jgi:hypothetical protein
MRARLISRILACCTFVLGGILLVEALLGEAVLPWEEPDETTTTASLFLLLLGMLVAFAGEFAALRERVEHLEQELRQRQDASA